MTSSPLPRGPGISATSMTSPLSMTDGQTWAPSCSRPSGGTEPFEGGCDNVSFKTRGVTADVIESRHGGAHMAKYLAHNISRGKRINCDSEKAALFEIDRIEPEPDG